MWTGGQKSLNKGKRIQQLIGVKVIAVEHLLFAFDIVARDFLLWGLLRVYISFRTEKGLNPR